MAEEGREGGMGLEEISSCGAVGVGGKEKGQAREGRSHGARRVDETGRPGRKEALMGA